MRRADRLFRIVQRLRRRGVTTCAQLAEALDVSERTIYRDVQDLILSGVPVQGEAGVGYALPRDFDLPPLMFSNAEVEALVLGARVVKSWGDHELRAAADELLSKVEAVLPSRLKEQIPDAALFAPGFHVRDAMTRSLGPLRAAIRERKKVHFAYLDKHEAPSKRTVRPLGLFYWGNAWSLGAWCELRRDFRNFRIDRINDARILDEEFVPEAGRTLADFFRKMENEP
jgi:predicted DNA-binding transcriptional regulator YafY